DILVPSIFRLRQPLLFLRTPTRWLMPAIGGERPALAGAAARVALKRIVTMFAILAAPRSWISAAFKNYVAALIDHQRLACLKEQRDAPTQPALMSQADLRSGWDVFAPQHAGFYPIETYNETRFRWSEPAAMMSAWMNEGRHRISIECIPKRPLARAGLRFYVDGRPLPAQDISIGPDTIDITFALAQSGQCTLGWTCLRFHGKDDSRWLGLPIKRIVPKPAAQLSAPKLATIAAKGMELFERTRNLSRYQSILFKANPADCHAQVSAIRQAWIDIAGTEHDRAIERNLRQMRTSAQCVFRYGTFQKRSSFCCPLLQSQAHGIHRDLELIQSGLANDVGQQAAKAGISGLRKAKVESGGDGRIPA